MKILAIAGLESPYLDQIEQVLNNAGMAPAVIKHNDESLTFVEWHDIVINNLDIDYRYAKENAEYHNQLVLKVDEVYSADTDVSLWGWTDPKSVWTLDLWLDSKPSFHVLLPCFSPERWLASRLVADSENLEANEDLDQWLEVHQQLLRVHFRYPDRTVLVDGYRCLSSPQRFLDYLAEKWQMPLDSEGAKATELPELDPLALLLAQQVAHANSEVWSLQQTIEASLEAFSPDMEQGPHEAPYLFDVALQSYRDMTLALCRLGRVESLFTDARQECNVLQTRLAELEYLHEATLLNERGLITEVEKLSKAYQDQLDNGHELEKTVEVLKTELSTQAAQVVEYKGLINQLAVELEGSRRSEKDLLAELESLGSIQTEYNDLSEKTKQVQLQYQNAQDENTLLLQQVHVVQEELETVYLKTQEAEKKSTELLAERDHHAHLAAERQTQVVELTSQRDMEMKAKADAQTRIKALEQAQQELTAARDVLAQEKTALTQARDAEAKAKAEALSQRDAEAKAKAEALAQRDGEAKAKSDALSQRDAATKANADAQTRINALEQTQQELTAARDALAQEKAALTQARDAEAKAKAEALAQRDAEAKAKAEALAQRDAEAKARAAAQTQLETQTESTNDFRSQINALTMERDTLQQRLEELEKTMNRASMTESELKKQTDKATNLEIELKDSQEENELLLQQLHLVQEELESLFLKGQDSGHASEELTAERNRLAKLVTEKQSLIETLTKACDDLKTLSANRRDQIDAREKLITDLRERNKKLGADLKALHSENKVNDHPPIAHFR